MRKFEIIEKTPSPYKYNFLRKSVGWFEIEADIAERSLQNSIYSICAIMDNEIIGYARIIGDNGINYYIQDLIVIPNYQNKKIGTELFKSIMEYLNKNAPHNSFVALMAAKGKSNFYKKFNFIERPSENFGPGMCIILKK